ncbi:HNH endonuclease [Rhodococcoides fascians]|uniref:HNH endonuclease n=1 Tax=Rhodococcoides fascians TaxID=1828 RepID=UPI00068C4059
MAGKRANAKYCTKKCKLAASESRRNRDDAARYQAERERRIEYAADYAKRRPLVGQASRRKRKARLSEAGIFEVTGTDWERLVRQHRGCCFYCGEAGPMTMDHLLPICRGGRHSIGNLIPACATCNSSKRHRTVMEWRLRKRVSLVPKGGDSPSLGSLRSLAKSPLSDMKSLTG